ncbi:MAG: hypothetical protein GKS00_22585 [Alphaproteobacteria bacterium]|nr:hypothetical protein [Alphaproteobacteria bacterium]
MVKKDNFSVLAFVPNSRAADLRKATDAYALEVSLGRTPNVALNYAAAVYVQSHPTIQAGDARAMIRAAIGDDC